MSKPAAEKASKTKMVPYGVADQLRTPEEMAAVPTYAGTTSRRSFRTPLVPAATTRATLGQVSRKRICGFDERLIV